MFPEVRRADPSTIQNKFLVGYQGRFTCPGDREDDSSGLDTEDPNANRWSHWLHPNGEPATDLWPDVSSYTPAELFPVPTLKHRSGDNPQLFSSRNQRSVTRHFEWMSKHGIDGAFLQRSASNPAQADEDRLGKYVQLAAEAENRVFALMYDITDVSSDSMKEDWIHVVQSEQTVYSPCYLREQGKPVIYLWGIGFPDSEHTPSTIRAITTSIRSALPDGGAYIIAGVPVDWRNPNSDLGSDSEEWLDVWLTEFDAICPWSLGRYVNAVEADAYAESFLKGDIEFLNWRNNVGKWKQVDYMPVVWPGFSGYNMTKGECGFNSIKRDGGNFLWRQIFNSLDYGAKMVYGATWDEYDAGTAMMPAVVNQQLLPKSLYHPLMSLDEDGYNLPSDWYMRICGLAAEVLRGETDLTHVFPYTDLQNYWSSRPRYEVDFDLRSGGYEPSIVSTSSASTRILEHFPPPPYRSAPSSPSPSKLHMRFGASPSKNLKAGMIPGMLPPLPLSSTGRPLPAAPYSADSASTTFSSSLNYSGKSRFVVQNPSTSVSTSVPTPLTSPRFGSFPSEREVDLDIESVATAGTEPDSDDAHSVSPVSSTQSRERNKSMSIGRLLKAMSNSNRSEEYSIPKAAPGERKVVIRAARSSARRG